MYVLFFYRSLSVSQRLTVSEHRDSQAASLPHLWPDMSQDSEALQLSLETFLAHCASAGASLLPLGAAAWSIQDPWSNPLQTGVTAGEEAQCTGGALGEGGQYSEGLYLGPGI